MPTGSDGLLTVVGDVDTITDKAASGTLTVRLSDKLVVGNKVFAPIDQQVPLNPTDGTFSIKLPPTADSGVTYRFELVAYAYVNGQREHFEESFNTVLTADDGDAQGVVQYKDLAPVATPGVPSTFLTRTTADARYLLKTEIPELPSNLITEDNIGDFIEPVDLSGLATTAALGNVDTKAGNAATAAAAADTKAGNALTAAGTAQTTANNALAAAQQGGKPAGLTPFALRLADRANTPVNVVAIGSSSVQGSLAQPFTQKWVDLLGQMLHASYNPAGIPGGRHSLAGEDVKSNPANWAFTGSIQTDPVRGLGLISKRLSAGAAMTGSFDLTTGFTVQYAVGSGLGNFTVSIDDGAAITVTVPTTASANTHTGSWTTPSVLTRGTHTIKITAVGVTEISGVYAHDGDETLGVRMFNGGKGGTAAVDFLNQTTISQRLGTLNPGLVLLMYGSNDWKAGTTPAQFKTNVATHMSQIKAAVTGPLTFGLIGQLQRLDGAFTPDWSQYLDALKQLAAEVPTERIYIDAASMFPTVNDATGDPYDLIASDNLHPTTRGHALIADAVADALRLPNRNSTRVLSAAAATPQPPTALTISGTAGNGQATIGATGGSGATSYALYQGTTATGTPVATSFPATITGLTNGTAYSYIATATNAQGTVTSNTISVTPSNAVVYPADDFNRADGELNGQTTSVGSKTWRVANKLGVTTTGIISTISGAVGAPSITDTHYATIDLGTPDYVIEATLAARNSAVASAGGGLYGRIGSDGSGYFLSIRVNSTTQGYALYRQDVSGSTTTSTIIAQTTTVVPAAGDRLRMEFSGSSITCKVNGTALFAAVTDTGHTTGTGAGLFFNSSGKDTRWDNWAQVA